VTASPHRPRALETCRARAPRFISAAAVVVGLALVADVAMPERWRSVRLLGAFLPDPARATAEAVVLVCGLLLLRVARGLGKHKRAEWRVAVALCVAVIAADLLRAERRPVEAAAVSGLLVALVLARSRYTAGADPRGKLFAARVAAQFLAGAVGFGMFLLYLPGHVPAGISFWSRLREVILSLVGLGGWIPVASDYYADVFHAVLLILGLLTLVCGVVFWLRPVEPTAVLTESDEHRLRLLLGSHGARDSLGYFALRRDKSVVWSASGKAAITYRVVSGVALVSGDPIGDPEAWPGAIESYRRLVDHYGWTPAVIGCSELGATVFKREYGLSAVALGDEAVLYAAEFTLEGRTMRGVRQPFTRVERAGYVAAVRRLRDIGAAEIEEVRAAAQAWRTEPVERGYSMALSRVGDPADADCVLVTARRDGRLCGILHFVPWSDGGLSLDLMRRDRAADNGLNEFMIASLMAACPVLGVDRVSLNFAMFREALELGQRIGAGPVLQLWRRVLLVASRWWQIESLYRFNAKFAPHWQPRFFSYPRARDLPRILLATLEAEAFLVRPRAVQRMLGRARAGDDSAVGQPSSGVGASPRGAGELPAPKLRTAQLVRRDGVVLADDEAVRRA
jgi:lysyl-tRNA synthetase, class II